MKYLKIRPFKELQATVESSSESDDSDKIQIIEVPGNSKTGSKRCGDPVNNVTDQTNDKRIKLESSEPAVVASASAKLSTVQVFGHEIMYKQQAASVLFKTSSVVELLTSQMPLQQSKQLESVVDKSAFISWSGLKVVLKGGLLNLAIRESLLGEDPSQDTLMLNNVSVKCKIKNGTVYLDVMSAFSALGRRQEAESGQWAAADIALAAAGLSLKAAFKKKAAGEMSAVGARNFITLDALLIICTDPDLKEKISQLVDKVLEVKRQGERICTEIQQNVNMILRMSCIVPAVDTCSSSNDEDCSAAGSPRRRTLSGRGGQYSSRCCAKSHSFTIADKDIGYVRRNGQLYLEKCAAFDLICRLYVIRDSDYKTVDSILMKHSDNLSVKDFFLFDGEERSHISLNGLILLIEKGFDASCIPNLLSDILKIHKTHQGPRRHSCEEIETIDLSSSEVDMDTDDKNKESSSGADSEDQSPKMERKRLKSFQDYDSDDDSNFESCNNPISEFAELLGTSIPVQVINDNLYFDKNALVKTSGQVLLQGFKNLDKILADDLVLKDAFVHQGRNKVYISLQALQRLLESQEMSSWECRDALLLELAEISREYVMEKSQILFFPNGEELKYKLVKGIIFLETYKLLRLSGFTPSYFSQPPAKSNLFLCKVLSDRGLNTNNCFFKNGKSKYGFISIAAASVLLRSDLGHLKDNEVSQIFVEQLMEAIESLNILNKNTDTKPDMTINILDEFPPIKYKIVDGKLFLHRKSSFECLELESSVLNNRKGYTALNNILKMNGLDVDKCYLASRQQKYCYISCLALVTLLQAQDPLIVCLTNKDKFMAGLINVLQQAAIKTDDSMDHVMIEDEKFDVKIQAGVLYLDRLTILKMSGLADDSLDDVSMVDQDPRLLLEERGLVSDKACLPRGEDPCGWISLHCLYVLLSNAIAELNIHKVAWRDILSAIALYQPRVKTKLRLEDIKAKIFEKFEDCFVEYSSGMMEGEQEGHVRHLTNEVLMNKELSLPVTNRYLNKVRFSNDQLVPGSDTDPNSPQPPSNLHSPSVSCFPSPTGSVSEPQWMSPATGECSLSTDRFNQLRQDILQHAGENFGESFIGDWRLDSMEESYLKLSVKSGYGASRKNSFLQPDFAAILRYCMILTPTSAFLTINEKHVKSEVIKKIIDRTEIEGTLSFLVQVISLRPCFGSFAPELVETVAQALSKEEVPDNLQHVFIDNNFIGSSSCGRTYAGTVRHNECDVLAMDRVSDVCCHCRQLSGLTINRSLLSQEQTQETVKEKGQKSVWQLATTSSDACNFVCPQVQSFNSSLPHAFDGRAQASTIVSHRVEISNELDVQVQLSDRTINKTFEEFQKSRQLGPLLDCVASLRLCVGYPNTRLVEQARYILDNTHRINNDARKLFKHLTVDDKFVFTMTRDEENSTGTIRSISCSSLAEPSSDICSHCRTLQEPIEFLSN